MLLTKIKDVRNKFRRLFNGVDYIEVIQNDTLLKHEYMQEALGRIEQRQCQALNDMRLQHNEFRVFSQFGEDGIIQFLLRHVPVERKIFVEFGVETYKEANTRFLLRNYDWAGMVIDGSKDNIDRIKADRTYAMYSLTAVHSFITVENINGLLTENGLSGDIGLLSVDIDGNDYWVWQAINVISPRIVIAEYNYRFGKEASVTVPYDPGFVRSNAHASWIYFGASLKALCRLADQKGYALVGCGSTGLNAFFVRRDVMPACFEELTAEEGYIEGKFSETRDNTGIITKMPHQEQTALIMNLPLVDIDDKQSS